MACAFAAVYCGIYDKLLYLIRMSSYKWSMRKHVARALRCVAECRKVTAL